MFAAVCGMLLKACWLLAYLDIIATCTGLLGLVWFSFVLGALSNRLSYVSISYGLLHLLASKEVQLPHQKVSELLSFWSLCLLFQQQQNWSDQAEKETAANMEMLVFSPSLPLHFTLREGIYHGLKEELWHRTLPLLQTGGWYFMGAQLRFKLSSVGCIVNFFLWIYI